MNRFFLLFWCVAVALVSYIALDFYSTRNAPLFKKFERQWKEDVQLLEASGKLPKAWFDVGEIKINGGTPDTRSWLQRIKVPITAKPNGKIKLEVLVVAWEENGTIGTLIQYNLSDRETGYGMWELGRTLIQKDRKASTGAFQEFLDQLVFKAK